MSEKIIFIDGSVATKKGAKTTTLDFEDVFNFDKFEDYLQETQNPNEEKYWKIVTDEYAGSDVFAKYLVKGNLQAAVLKSFQLPRADLITEDITNFIEDTVPEYCELFFKEKQYKGKHDLSTLRLFLAEEYLKGLTMKVNYFYFEETQMMICV